MAADEEEGWPEYTVFFRELGAHAGGRSYYEDELEEELERLNLGEVVGGGTWMDGSGCDIHIAVRDPEAGLRAIRELLRRLNPRHPRASAAMGVRAVRVAAATTGTEKAGIVIDSCTSLTRRCSGPGDRRAANLGRSAHGRSTFAEVQRVEMQQGEKEGA